MAYSNQQPSKSDRRRVESYQRTSQRNRLNTPRERMRQPRYDRVRTHNIRFNNRPRPRGFFARYDSRGLLMFAAAIVVVFLIVFGIVGCVRSCVAPAASTEEPAAKETNSVDARVASGVSDDLSRDLASALDNSEDMTWIAEHADEYDDEAIIQLALRENSAISFVRQVPRHEKTSEDYGDIVTQGTYPELVCWDKRWGFVDYAGLPLGVTGSGPTVAAIAYMGLTGKNDQTPANLAKLAADGNWATGDSSTTGDFFAGVTGDLGMNCVALAVSTDSCVNALSQGRVVACEMRAGSLTSEAHWVLISGTNADGTLHVIDPTAPEVTAHEWSGATITAGCAAMYALGNAQV